MHIRITYDLRTEAGRASLEGEIAELEGVRAALQNDVVVLERHVDEQREVVQAAIGELQSLLDHPDAFRVAEPTGVSAAASPVAGDTAMAAAPQAEPEPTQAVPATGRPPRALLSRSRPYARQRAGESNAPA